MRPTSFRFKPVKAMQAAAVLLDAEQTKQMSYYRLLKLLYFADRRHLQETGRPIIGGRTVAMDQGPLSSQVYDLIRKEHSAYPEWSQFFRIHGRYIEMLKHPGNGELSRREIRTLLAEAKKFEDREDDELGVIAHRLKEYQDNYVAGTSTVIPLSDIVRAVGRADEEAAILKDAEQAAVLDRILGE